MWHRKEATSRARIDYNIWKNRNNMGISIKYDCLRLYVIAASEPQSRTARIRFRVKPGMTGGGVNNFSVQR